MNHAKQIIGAINSFGVGNKIPAQDICDMLDKEKLVFYREKYGFIRILTGYNPLTEKFRYVQAPLGYCMGEVSTYLHLFTLGMCHTYEKDFDEIEYFSGEIKPINKFWKWYLVKICKLI